MATDGLGGLGGVLGGGLSGGLGGLGDGLGSSHGLFCDITHALLQVIQCSGRNRGGGPRNPVNGKERTSAGETWCRVWVGLEWSCSRCDNGSDDIR